ncbi:MAG: 5'-nucleotidase [Pseudomonadota bacterium]
MTAQTRPSSPGAHTRPFIAFNPNAHDAAGWSAGTHVYDFDGVLSDDVEEQVYRIEHIANEDAILRKLREQLHIRCEGLPNPYQRHLLFQEIQLRRHIPIKPGPALEWARKTQRDGRIFILTARSGYAAIARMHEFIQKYKLNPIEIFHVGRVEKSAQLKLLSAELQDGPIFFYEDNINHLKAAYRQLGTSIVPILIDHTPKANQAKARALLDSAFSSQWGIDEHTASTESDNRRAVQGA